MNKKRKISIAVTMLIIMLGVMLTTTVFALTSENEVSNDVYTNEEEGQGKILNFGDSIAEGYGNDGKGYAELIAEQYGMICYDKALLGATVRIKENSDYNLNAQIDEAIEEKIEADYILLNGGLNDAMEDNSTLGAISEGYGATLDESTFCGAFESMLKKIQSNWKDAKLVYVCVHRMSSRDTRLKTRIDLAKEMCEKWHTSYVDLFYESEFDTNIEEMKLLYTQDTYNTGTGDGTNPNELGYNTYYVPVIYKEMQEPDEYECAVQGTILNLGDSIAAGYSGEGCSGKGYAELIAEEYYGLTCYDKAVGGATVRTRETTTNNINSQINRALKEQIEPDYILLDGGTNDALDQDTTLGSISDGYSETFDESTFCGAFESVLSRITSNWEDSKVIYICVHRMCSRSDRLQTRIDLAKQMCEKWSIPYIDLFYESRLNTHLSGMRAMYTIDTYNAGTGDGTHPNKLGYDTYYVPVIYEKMEELSKE
jgi:lysophospholipase L1-like esterase